MINRKFGDYVTVYVTTPNILNDYNKIVEINWSAIGSQDADTAELFANHLREAINYARSVEAINQGD
jgi:hypothetical protein